MAEFKREERYIVIKRKDLDGAPDWLRHGILYALQEAQLPERKCVVIESDWPEYERVWQMIEDRMAQEGGKCS